MRTTLTVPLELLAVDGGGGGIDGVDKAMRQGDASANRTPSRLPTRPSKGGRRCKTDRRARLDELLGFFLQSGCLQLFCIFGCLFGEDDMPHAHHPGWSRQRIPRGGIAAVDKRLRHAGDAHEVKSLLDGAHSSSPNEHRSFALGVGDGDRRTSSRLIWAMML